MKRAPRSGAATSVPSISIVVAVLFAAAEIGCSSSESKPGGGTPGDGSAQAVTDGGPTATGGTDGGAQADAASAGGSGGGGSQPDASVMGGSGGSAGGDAAVSADGGACHAVANVASTVDEVNAAVAQPAPAGGSLTSGTYILTAYQINRGPGGATGPTGTKRKTTIELSGIESGTGTARLVTSKNGEPDQRVTFSVVVAGTSLQLTAVCPGPTGQSQLGFNAITNGFQLLDAANTNLQTFTKVGAAGGSDGGVPTPDAAAACTNLSTDQVVTSQAGTGDYPTPAGGPIADGTYVLTKFEIWPPDTTPPTAVMFRSAFRFTGNMVEMFGHVLTDGRMYTGKGTYSLANGAITFAYNCPVVGGYAKPYTATPTQFIWFENQGTGAQTRRQIWTFTKQ
jgi:hypothetical protein